MKEFTIDECDKKRGVRLRIISNPTPLPYKIKESVKRKFN